MCICICESVYCCCLVAVCLLVQCVLMGHTYYYEFLKSHSLIREYEIQGASRWWRCLYDHQPHSNLWKTIPSINIFPGLKLHVLILFFMVCLSTLSVAQITWHQIIGWLAIINLEDVEGSDHGLLEVLRKTSNSLRVVSPWL